MSRLDHRWLLLKKGTAGQDEIVDLLLNEPSGFLPAVEEIYSDKIQRSAVEAALLSTPDVEVISAVLEVPAAVLMLFRDLCFNIEGLSKLQRMSYIGKLRDKEEQKMKIWAITQGPSFLKWRFGGDVTISPVDGLQSIFSDAYYKSKEAFFSGNDSEASKEAAKWAKIAMDAGKQLKAWVSDADHAMQDINLALEQISGDDIQFKTIDDLEE